MDAAARQAILVDVKTVLDVTWDDEQTNDKLLFWIDSGAAYLDGKLGETGNYQQAGLPRTLLFEYVRYARDAALDVFENNYLPLILGMQHDRKVAAYELEETAAADA